jgi:putative ABC transport system permease protein
MWKLFIKIFIRNFLKAKATVLLNLLSLILGITCFLFALLFFTYETGYDNFHVNKDRIARVVTTTLSGDNETQTALSNSFLALTLPKQFPEIAGMVRFKRFEGRAAISVKDRQKNFSLDNIYYSDPGVFGIFSYPLKAGNPLSCLSEPNSIVLSKKTAQKLFGDRSAINQVVQVNDKMLQVTAVADEPPGNTDFTFEGLISMATLSRDAVGPWTYTYILFNSVHALDAFPAKLDRYAREQVNPAFKQGGISIAYNLEPMGSIHFSNHSVYDTPKGNQSTINIFLISGILILIISFTNSINLTVVKAFSRSREVAIQKIFGASRGVLIKEQALESVMIGLVAAVFSFQLLWLFLPELALFLQRDLSIADLLNWKILISIPIALFVLGAGGALYTGIYLKKMQLAEILRTGTTRGFKMKLVPRLMLGTQFFISLGMVVASLVVFRQVEYLLHAPLGFNPKNVLIIDLPQGQQAANGDKYLKNQLRADPDIINTALCGANSLPGAFTEVDVFEYQDHGVRVKKGVDNIGVDADYLNLLQIPILNGDGFQRSSDTGSSNSVIVTSSFAKRAGWDHPIGEKIVIEDETDQVVGVVPDFHFSSLHSPVAPLVIFQDPGNPAFLLVRAKEGKTSSVMGELRSAWKKAFPAFPFYSYFMDQHLLQQYHDEGNLLKLLLSLSTLIIIISSIGLMAYVSFIMRMSRVEIAIRRIIGASFRHIHKVYNRQFVILLLVAFFAACPISWALLDKWLRQFPYHVSLQLTDLLVAFGAMAFVVGAVISYHVWKSIRLNPAAIIREK